MVKDACRGPTLEVVVSRMKAIHFYCLAQDPQSKTRMRFVAVSATIPNVCDVRNSTILKYIIGLPMLALIIQYLLNFIW